MEKVPGRNLKFWRQEVLPPRDDAQGLKASMSFNLKGFKEVWL